MCKRDPNAPKIGETSSNCNKIGLSLKQGNPTTSDRQKCEWANSCKIQWDGISSTDCNVRSNLPNSVIIIAK